VTVLAASSVASQVYPGLAGFLVVAGMGLALYFLFRSLNKQLRKITPASQAGPQARSRSPRAGLAAYRAMQAQEAAQAEAGPEDADPGLPDQPPGSTRP
jgi:hypothetical protein